MKTLPALFTLLAYLSITSCNSDTDNEIPCTCDEIVDMQVMIVGQSSPTYEVEVDYCDLNGTLIEQVTQQQYDTLNVGDCF